VRKKINPNAHNYRTQHINPGIRVLPCFRVFPRTTGRAGDDLMETAMFSSSSLIVSFNNSLSWSAPVLGVPSPAALYFSGTSTASLAF